MAGTLDLKKHQNIILVFECDSFVHLDHGIVHPVALSVFFKLVFVWGI